MNKQLLTILLFLASFYIQAQQYNNDTLPIYTTNQYFGQCADSLGKKYQLHFEQESGGISTYYFQEKRFKENYGEGIFNKISEEFRECQYNFTYDFYTNQCPHPIDTSFMNLMYFGQGYPIIIQNYDHSLNLLKCSFNINRGLFDFYKRFDSELEHDTIHSNTSVLIEYTIYSNEKGKSIRWKQILEQYFQEELIPHLKKLQITFKAKQNDPPLKKEGNRITAKVSTSPKIQVR